MNSTEIISRLKEVLDHYNLTSSTFADTIDVQRSSISHLMSGRNKPSLDFVLKVIESFPEVDLYWLLNGKGSFPKEKEITTPQPKEIEKIKEKPTPTLFSQKEEPQTNNEIPFPIHSSSTHKKLIKVILLYSDGSFEDFNK